MTQDRPNAPDLLDAVAEYLFTEVRGAVPSEHRFRVLVAANICAVVAREMRAGEAPVNEDLRLFAGLLDREPAEGLAAAESRDAVREAEAELCERLRAGEFDERLDEIADALRPHVRRKLAVARPGYDGAD